jgi:hypothetical protein
VAAPAVDLRGNVSSLVQAMSAFGSGEGAAATGGTLKLDGSNAGGGVNTAVAAMADALKQFDANGQLFSSTQTAATDAELRLKALRDTGSHGFLAAPQK